MTCRGRAERHGFEYYRHGTLSLYAALDHADVFVVAESSRDLVVQGRARRDCSRNLFYQREGSGPQASPLYQRLLSER